MNPVLRERHINLNSQGSSIPLARRSGLHFQDDAHAGHTKKRPVRFSGRGAGFLRGGWFLPLLKSHSLVAKIFAFQHEDGDLGQIGGVIRDPFERTADSQKV